MCSNINVNTNIDGFYAGCLKESQANGEHMFISKFQKSLTVLAIIVCT
jgi:hypothetical protein